MGGLRILKNNQILIIEQKYTKHFDINLEESSEWMPRNLNI